MKWVVRILVAYHEQDFEFENASDAEAFAKIAHDTMLPYDEDKEGNPKMAKIKVMAHFKDDEKEDE